MHNCSAEEEIARWKATAEQEAAVGTGVEQEFVAQLKSIEMNFNLMMECMENVGESLLSLSNPANHVAPPAFPRFTEDGDHFTTLANMATQPLTYIVDDGRSQVS
ncbi:hypothetical protein FF2_024857 [Malus domestica]